MPQRLKQDEKKKGDLRERHEVRRVTVGKG